MSHLNNADYYRRRVTEARAHAEDATLPEVRRVHAEMAVRYTQLLAEVERSERPGGARPMLGIVPRD
jgi:CpcD/allophycocyanin linker domain